MSQSLTESDISPLELDHGPGTKCIPPEKGGVLGYAGRMLKVRIARPRTGTAFSRERFVACQVKSRFKNMYCG